MNQHNGDDAPQDQDLEVYDRGLFVSAFAIRQGQAGLDA